MTHGSVAQERLAIIETQARERGSAEQHSPKEQNWSHAFFRLYADLPLSERQARSFAYALEHEPIYIHPLTRIAGQIFQACPGSGCPERTGRSVHPGWADFCVISAGQRRIDAELPDARYCSRYFTPGGYPGHICGDFGPLLERGVTGILEMCAEGKQQISDARSHEFFTCTEIALRGLLRWVDGHVRALERDLEAGSTTLDEAREFVTELFIKMHERVAPHDGWVEAIPVGAGGRASLDRRRLTPSASPFTRPTSGRNQPFQHPACKEHTQWNRPVWMI